MFAAISSGDYNTVKFLVNNRGSRLKTVLVPTDYKKHKILANAIERKTWLRVSFNLLKKDI